MPVYKVTCTLTFMAVEESSFAAGLNAGKNLKEHMEDYGVIDQTCITDVNSVEDIPEDWLGCVPYGDQTIDDTSPVESYLIDDKDQANSDEVENTFYE